MNILITGSTKGLGRSLSHQLSQNGYNIITHSRKEIPTHPSWSTHHVVGELSDPNACSKIAENLRDENLQINALICNAGSGRSKPMGEERLEDWVKSFNDNFYSTLHIIKELEDDLQIVSGKIICIGSICGSRYIKGAPLTYSCAKATIQKFVENYSIYLAEKNIQIINLELGNMMFQGSTWEIKLQEERKKVENMLEHQVPLKRLGNPEDFIGFIDWFLSKENRFMTGTKVTCDGGQIIL